MSPDNNIRYFVSVAFAVLIVALGFYALVLYEFALPELIQGFFVSVMTLAVQYVFGEQLAAGTARRVRQSYEAGSAASTASSPTVTASGADTVTVEPTPTEPIHVEVSDTERTTGGSGARG